MIKLRRGVRYEIQDVVSALGEYGLGRIYFVLQETGPEGHTYEPRGGRKNTYSWLLFLTPAEYAALDRKKDIEGRELLDYYKHSSPKPKPKVRQRTPRNEPKPPRRSAQFLRHRNVVG